MTLNLDRTPVLPVLWRSLAAVARRSASLVSVPRRGLVRGRTGGIPLALLLGLAAGLPPRSLLAGDSYRLEIVAQTGTAGLTVISPFVSINNAGLVAFQGQTAEGSGCFVSDGSGPPQTAYASGARSLVGKQLQLNDGGNIVGRRGTFITSSDPVYYNDPILGPILFAPAVSEAYDFVQTWSATGQGAPTLIAKGKTETSSPPLNQRTIGPFASVGGSVSLNNLGQVAFMADAGTPLVSSYVLATPKAGNTFNSVPCWSGAQPMLADNGWMVLRDGRNDSDAIIVYDYELTSARTVASAARGFTSLGRYPGISDDGQYVAFCGDLSDAGAKSLNLTPGPGIFLAVFSGAGMSTHRMAGLNAPDGTPQFASFDGNTRVGVSTLTSSGDALVVFAAKDPEGANGIWTRAFLRDSRAVSAAAPVLRSVDLIAGWGTPVEFQLHDSVNAKGELAVWVKSGASQAIVRAMPFSLEIDTLDDQNTVNHHTSQFITANTKVNGSRPLYENAIQQLLILRRGNTFDIAFKIPSAMFPNLEFLGFEAKDLIAKTVTTIPVSDGTPASDSWAAFPRGDKTEANGMTEVRYRFNIPVDAPVGEYEFSVSYRLNPGASGPTRQVFPEPIVVLFNPWDARGRVYLENDLDREEYLLKEIGFIWKGCYRYQAGLIVSDYDPKRWHFAQFSSPYCLNTVLHLLATLEEKDRRSPALVARYFTQAGSCKSEAQPGVLHGKWPKNGDFTGGKPPGEWDSSADIFDQYTRNWTCVKYGQCWVFGGVLTSLLRAVGIPARPITNFSSAHSLDNIPNTVDIYYYRDNHNNLYYTDEDGCWDGQQYQPNPNPLCYTRDGVWNYHVWCEAMIDEWQAVDATPQENPATNEAYDGVGPAPLSMIRSQSGGGYDVNFLVEEVSAPVVRWQFFQQTDGTWVTSKMESTTAQPNPDTDEIGTRILTQRPSALSAEPVANEWPITDFYKETRHDPITKLRKQGDERNWDVEFQSPEVVIFGETVSYSVRLINRTVSLTPMRIALAFAAIDYTGVTVANLNRRFTRDVMVSPGQTLNWDVALNPEDYRNALVSSEIIEARLSVVETDQIRAAAIERRTGLARPNVALSLSDLPRHAQESFRVDASWTNWLGFALSEATLNLTTCGVETSIKREGGLTITQTNLLKGECIQAGEILSAFAEGYVIVTGALSSPDSIPLEASKILQIGPELRLRIRRLADGSLDLVFPALMGRRYVLESNAGLTAAGWVTQGGEIIGEGVERSVVPKTQGQRTFYRIRALQP